MTSDRLRAFGASASLAEARLSSARAKADRGMTLVELLVMIVIVTVLLVIAVTQLIRARARGNETSAVASLRMIVAGEIAYSVSCGQGGFAPNLIVLARPAPGSQVSFVPPEFTTGSVVQKSGYSFTVSPAQQSVPYKIDCNGTRNTSAFYASARPVSYGSGGFLSFAVISSGTIWSVEAATPPPEPFGPPASPIR
jgi:prepilin-type N-terminal cleavage/methylation domain-containing protein